MSEIYTGNGVSDGGERRGWIVGSFLPEGIRQQESVEIKYGVHRAGEVREDWVTDETRTTICLLISGEFQLEFRDQSIQLKEQGDYAMWNEDVDHKWHAVEDSVVLTIRWADPGTAQ